MFYCVEVGLNPDQYIDTVENADANGTVAQDWLETDEAPIP